MPSRLTFGVELEFALALLEEGKIDPEPTLPQPVHFLSSMFMTEAWGPNFKLTNTVLDLVTTKMLAAGLPTRAKKRGRTTVSSESSHDSAEYQKGCDSWNPSQEHSGQQLIIKSGDSYGFEIMDFQNQGVTTSESESDEKFGNKWMVTEDPTVRPTRPENYWWFQMEVQSPPYILCEDSLEAVRLACTTLTKEFRVETNASTGLHVHVAEGGDGYAFQTVKKLMAFLWTFEPQIDQLHPNRRARLRGDEEFTWYESIRRGSELVGGQFTDVSVQLTVIQGLRYIYAADSIGALNDMMMSRSWKSAYYLGAIGHGTLDDNTIKKTIEFRQHEGTVSGDRIVGWIKTIAALMEWIVDVEPMVLLELLEGAANFEDRSRSTPEKLPYDIIDLLKDIGLMEQARYWDSEIPKATRIPPTPYYKVSSDPPQQAPENELIDNVSPKN